MTRRLLYVMDPMCSWCYGFTPTLELVASELTDDVCLEPLLGGLAPDSEAPMPTQTRAYVQAAWHAVAERTGVTFNHAFWQHCAPRRSTYPACRAVLVARDIGRGWQMIAAIQRAYYQEARNPSDLSTLVELAGELGLDERDFAVAMGRARDEGRLDRDLERCARLGAQSFPSLALADASGERLVVPGCLDAGELRGVLGGAGLLG